ncbi:sensor histidine kinase [Flavobacterium sp.]|uniref:sensor histidine kinase n=1 Tax=Flavobacterium sp. TaxID=239 RepID=UPI002628B5D4|nr:sensor histidine kinase [Flavobacterium sp.]
MYFKAKEKLFFIAFLLSVSFSLAQNATLKLIETELLDENKDNLMVLKKLSSIDLKKISANDSAKYFFLKAKFYENTSDDKNALQYFIKSKNKYLSLNKIDEGMDINLNISYLLSCYQGEKNKHQNYLDEYLDYALKSKNDEKLLKAYTQIASLKINKKEANESLYYFRKAIQLNKKIKNKHLESKIYNNVSVLFSEILDQPDSSLYYLRKDYLLIDKEKYPLSLCYNLTNQASNYYHQKKYSEAINLLYEADKIKLKKYSKNIKANINEFLYLNYKGSGNTEKALFHFEISRIYRDSINKQEQSIAINEIETKYKTKEKEIENLSLKNKLQNNTIVLNISIGILLIAFFIGILIYKNLAKKKKIIEQEKLLEAQILEKKLKEQELHEIDLMLETQERERQMIANELHDNLGSLLATLKLNFQNLKDKKISNKEVENRLYEKTDDLIEEAYQEVRNISHLKNLGVVGTQGLVEAVKKMAEKMSVIEKIKINVIPFGMNDRLENQKEIMLFRIIQELGTNIIKHSEATEVNIYLTQHNHTDINIIIEDNGKGFDPKKIKYNDGIGLKSIEKKVEQMNGTFTIDSLINKGTTIIIDLPL